MNLTYSVEEQPPVNFKNNIYDKDAFVATNNFTKRIYHKVHVKSFIIDNFPNISSIDSSELNIQMKYNPTFDSQKNTYFSNYSAKIETEFPVKMNYKLSLISIDKEIEQSIESVKKSYNTNQNITTEIINLTETKEQENNKNINNLNLIENGNKIIDLSEAAVKKIVENEVEILNENENNNENDFNNIKNCEVPNLEEQSSNINDEDSYEERIIFPVKIRFEANFEYDQNKEK